MSESESSSSGGIGLGGAVFVVFLVLKLVDIEPVASWSWWWVTSPLWGMFALVIAFGAAGLLGIGAFAAVGSISESISSSRGRRKRMRDVMDD